MTKYNLMGPLSDRRCNNIRKALKIVPSRINALHFSEVDRLLDNATLECNELKNYGIVTNDEILSNTAFLMGAYCDMWKSISLFWESALSKKYNSAWACLQDAIDYCNVLIKNVDKSELNLNEIAEYLLCYENAFPYNMFLSMGISSKSHCSICKKDSFDVGCEHVPGKIYWGQLANLVVIVTNIQEISLVRSPRDKRCVPIDYPDSFFSNLQELFDYIEKPLNKVTYYSDAKHIGVDLKTTITALDSAADEK